MMGTRSKVEKLFSCMNEFSKNKKYYIHININVSVPPGAIMGIHFGGARLFTFVPNFVQLSCCFSCLSSSVWEKPPFGKESGDIS